MDTSLIHPYIFAIFDGDDNPGDQDDAPQTGDADAGAGDATPSKTPQRSQPQRTTRQPARDDGGRFQADDSADLRRELENAQGQLASAQKRIGELNDENAKNRHRLNAADQRVIRAEARDALTQAGAISPRIVDLFLNDHADKVKIDQKTGEPIGIRENIDGWKTANVAFFKQAQPADDAPAGKDGDADDKADKPNRTGKGATTRGAANDQSGNSGGMPDLRGLSAKERTQAINAYKQSLRGSRGA